jgi:hypothetical protein
MNVSVYRRRTWSESKKSRMIRRLFAVAVAASAFTTISGPSQAAPVAPLPAGVASYAATGNIAQAGSHHLSLLVPSRLWHCH